MDILSLLASLSLFYSFLDAFDYDPFDKHIRLFLNNSVNPCDNFFRHVCPLNFNEDDSLMVVAEKEMRQFVEVGKRIMKQPEVNMFSKLIDKYIMQFEKEERSLLHMANTLYKGLFDRSAILLVLTSDPNEFNFERYRVMVEQLNDTMWRELAESRSLYGEKQWLHFLGWHHFQQYFLPLQDENILDINRYHTIIAMIGHNYDDFFRIRRLDPFSEWNILRRKSLFVDVINVTVIPYVDTIKLLVPNLYVRLKDSLLWNAENSYKRYVTMQESIILPILNDKVTLASMYGSAGYVFAHEMVHSYLKPDELGKDPKFDGIAKCQMQHFSDTCERFREGDCSSGNSTFFEDAPDVEGIQVAYKTFRNQIGNRIEAKAYATSPITNNQMFFYSAAITYCRSFQVTQQWRNNAHSAPYVRINGMFSLMKSFQNAFRCPNTSKMVVNERCNYFGSPV